VGLSHLDEILWVASSVLAGLAVWRILQQRLFVSPFRALAVLLGVVLVRDGVVSIPAYDRRAYTVAWAWTLPFLLAAQVWAGHLVYVSHRRRDPDQRKTEQDEVCR